MVMEHFMHGMGIIAVITPGSQTSKHVPRISVSSDNLTTNYKSISHISKHLRFQTALQFRSLLQMTMEDPIELVDLLWKVSPPIRFPHPGWSGMMHMVSER